MQEPAPGITLIDTLLGGMPEVNAAYLVTGAAPALVDTGARTSAPVLRAALAAAGLGPDDLAWIVPTHVHLDHCGATGILAAAFPRARVVVHRRGARHLADPGRLVAGAAAVYGARWSIYGGLDRTPADRIDAVEDGHAVHLGGGRVLRMIETLGHARHHMSVLDESTGTVLAGDAAGARLPGSGAYPTLPPPDVDLDRADASLARIAALRPTAVCAAHFGPMGPPEEAIATAREHLALLRRAAAAPGDLGAAIDRLLPLDRFVGTPDALARWRRLGWAPANVLGMRGWIAAADGTPA